MNVNRFIISLLILLVVASCNYIDAPIKTSGEGVQYKYFTIDGMPCVYITQGDGQSMTGGPSCDWSKWDGK